MYRSWYGKQRHERPQVARHARLLRIRGVVFFLDNEAAYDNVDDNFGVEFSDENDTLMWNDKVGCMSSKL